MTRPSHSGARLTRRAALGRLLRGAGAVAAGGLALSGRPRRARAIGDDSMLALAQVRHSGNWNPRPTAALALAEEIRYRTSIDVRLERTQVTLAEAALFSHPFLLLQSGGELPRLSRVEADNLKKFLELGGFLLADNVGKMTPSEPFDRSFRAELKRLFPAYTLERIPAEHVLYRSFYRIDYPAGRILDSPYLEGLALDGRYAVVYSRNDLSGAWSRDEFGGWQYDVMPGGEAQRETALRLGVNLAMYALCLDYKDDHVHIEYLLRQRRWRIEPPPTGP
jgi:hypothetical protein